MTFNYDISPYYELLNSETFSYFNWHSVCQKTLKNKWENMEADIFQEAQATPSNLMLKSLHL